MTAATDLETLVVRRRFTQKPEDVFSAFSTPEALESWFSPSAEIAMEVCAFDFRSDGRYRYKFILPDAEEISVSGRFVEIDRPRLLSFTWIWDEPDIHAGIATLVTIDFRTAGDGTELVITHARLEAPGMRDRHADGWRGSLDRLVVWLGPQG